MKRASYELRDLLIKKFEAASITQFELSVRMGVHPESVSIVMRGDRVPRVDFVQQALHHLGYALTFSATRNI